MSAGGGEGGDLVGAYLVFYEIEGVMFSIFLPFFEDELIFINTNLPLL